MFKVDVTAVTAEVISADQVGIKNPADLKKTLSIPQMKAFAEKYLGKVPEKGSTKDAVALELFKAIAANLGYSAEEVEAGVNYQYPEIEKPVKQPKEKKAKVPREPKERSTARSFNLLKGSAPVAAEGQKVKWNEHAAVFAEAIVAMVDEGRNQASREDICKKADELGISTRKATTQDSGQLFSFWRGALIENGYLSAIAAEKKVEETVPAAAEEAVQA